MDILHESIIRHPAYTTSFEIPHGDVIDQPDRYQKPRTLKRFVAVGNTLAPAVASRKGQWS
jgi:hypothetical protein